MAITKTFMSEYKLSKWDKIALKRRPRLKDLLKKKTISTITEIEYGPAGAPGSEWTNYVKIHINNVVPAGFNGKIMCMQQQYDEKIVGRKVKVTIELI